MVWRNYGKFTEPRRCKLVCILKWTALKCANKEICSRNNESVAAFMWLRKEWCAAMNYFYLCLVAPPPPEHNKILPFLTLFGLFRFLKKSTFSTCLVRSASAGPIDNAFFSVAFNDQLDLCTEKQPFHGQPYRNLLCHQSYRSAGFHTDSWNLCDLTQPQLQRSISFGVESKFHFGCVSSTCQKSVW